MPPQKLNATHITQTPKGRYSQRLSKNPKRKGDHQHFREDESFFRQILESLEDYAVLTTDLDGHVSSWNTGAENLLGYTEAEIIANALWSQLFRQGFDIIHGRGFRLPISSLVRMTFA